MVKDTWRTPKWLAEALGEFDLDPCSGPGSHVQAMVTFWDGLNQDGLVLNWGPGSVFCNPPYSNVMPWARRLRAHPGPWVALVKLDPTTKWWRELTEGGEYGGDMSWPTPYAFRARIRFERDDKPPLTANFPSALVCSNWNPPQALRPHLYLDGLQ